MFIWYIITYCLILNWRALKMGFAWMVIALGLFLVIDLSLSVLQHEWLTAWLWIIFYFIWMREICGLDVRALGTVEVGMEESCGYLCLGSCSWFLFVLEYRCIYNQIFGGR